MAESKTADWYIGSQLYARYDTKVYKAPNGTPYKTYKPGAYIGTIESWVLRDGFVWWMLKDMNFVKHVPGQFDVKIAEETASGAKIVKEQEVLKTLGEDNIGSILATSTKEVIKGAGEIVKGAGEVAKGAGESIGFVGRNLLLFLIIIVIILYLFNKNKK